MLLEMKTSYVCPKQDLLIKFYKNVTWLTAKRFKHQWRIIFKAGTSEEILMNVPYGELIGCLNYLSMVTRPDICYAMSFLGRYLVKRTVIIWKTEKRILRYLKKASIFT